MAIVPGASAPSAVGPAGIARGEMPSLAAQPFASTRQLCRPCKGAREMCALACRRSPPRQPLDVWPAAVLSNGLLRVKRSYGPGPQ